MKIKYHVLAALGYVLAAIFIAWFFAGWAIIATLMLFKQYTISMLTSIWWLASWVIAILFIYREGEKEKQLKKVKCK
jgi:hypothetical protein